MPKKLSLASALGLAIAFAAFATGTQAAAQTETILHTFTDSKDDGGYPRSGLTFDQAGNLYGTTSEGGHSGGGAVYELKSNGSGDWAFNLLYSFPYKPKYGANEISAVIFANGGNLYGTTPLGGNYNDGQVFELLPPQNGGDWTEKLLHNFGGPGTDGIRPNSVTADPSGNLYGTTVYGGANTCEFSFTGCGVIFEMAQKNGHWVEQILYNFQYNGVDGYQPYFGLTRDAAGNLYGTTEYGGAYNQGTVFKLSQSAGVWTETVIHSFGATGDTGYPSSTLIFNNGNLYGATANGGSGAGNVFELSPSTGGAWTENIIYAFPYDFGGTAPALPDGIGMDAAGNIYGLAATGGTGQSGAVFELTPQSGGTWNENTLYNFDYYASGGIDGSDPVGNPVLDSHGNLYGVTVYGGAEDAGTVFEITP